MPTMPFEGHADILGDDYSGYNGNCKIIDASRKMLLESIIAGYEIGLRTGMLINCRQEEMFFGSETRASFGAAASAAKILGSENKTCIDALGKVEINTPLSLIMS